MSDVIYEDKERRLVIERSSTYTPECIALLERTVWGTRGLLYTMHDVAHTLDGIREPHFLALKENGELIAVAVRSRKTLGVGMHTYNAFHLALMAVDTPKIGRGYGKLLVEQSRRYFLGEVGTRGLLYGYIEAGNARSLALNAKLGYQPIGRFHTTLFSRLRPRDDPRVGRLNATERDTLVQRLNDLYADHALLDFEQSVEAEVYYVLRHAGEIIAGVQAERLHWSIRHLPGLRGMFLVRGLPSLPILRHLFATKDYHFLRLGNIYAQGGHEAEVFTLVEALLARQRLRSGIVFFDRQSPVYQRIAAAGAFGMLHAGLHAVLHVIAAFHGVPEEDVEDIQRRPLCMSPMDVL